MRRYLQCYRRQSTAFVNSTTCEQNTLIYDSLRVLLYAVCLYGVYRAFDTLSLSLYYVLLLSVSSINFHGQMPNTVQLILNLIHACGYTRASTRFTRVKVYNMACIFFVALGFVVRTCAIKHSWHTRHAPHEQTRHERTFS